MPDWDGLSRGIAPRFINNALFQHKASADPSRVIDRYHHKDRPDDWDMILLLRRPNYAALDQQAKVAAGCAKHFGLPEAAAAKKRPEFRGALATRL